MSEPSNGCRRTLERGTVLDGRFEIGQVLGAGAFGKVYQAKQIIFGHSFRDVALKLFDAEKVTPGNVREVFGDAVALISLQESSPDPQAAQHLIKIYDVGMVTEPSQQAFMSMRLIPGRKTLQHEITRFRHAGGIPVAASLRLLRQLLVPLAWMHAVASIVHGDLKPDNILMTEESNLVVTDFGLATHLPLGALGGAIAYQAPEILLNQPGLETSDVYAVVLVWYEMLTGCHPFHNVGIDALADGDERAFIRAHAQARRWPIRACREDEDPDSVERIVPASESNEELGEHPQLEGMLNRCLANLSNRRYPNARLLLKDIDEYIDKGTVEGLKSPAAAGSESDADVTLREERSPDALVQDARALLRQRRLPDAIARAKAALRMTGDRFVPAWLVWALAQAATGDIETAKEACRKAQERAPRDPEVFEAWAKVFEADGKAARADSMRCRAGKLRQSAGRKG